MKRLNTQAGTNEAALEKWYGEGVDELLFAEGIATDTYSRSRLLREVQRAWEQATKQQKKLLLEHKQIRH